MYEEMGCANDGDFVTSQLLIIVFPHFKSAMAYFFSHDVNAVLIYSPSCYSKPV